MSQNLQGSCWGECLCKDCVCSEHSKLKLILTVFLQITETFYTLLLSEFGLTCPNIWGKGDQLLFKTRQLVFLIILSKRKTYFPDFVYLIFIVLLDLLFSIFYKKWNLALGKLSFLELVTTSIVCYLGFCS